MSDKTQQRPPQHQTRKPGLEKDMTPTPESHPLSQVSGSRLQGKVALITGGDSGIGRAVGLAFAREGADVGIIYLNEHEDAEETKRLIEKEGRRCLIMAGDVGDETFCRKSVDRTLREFGTLDIVVNNAAEQHPQDSLEDITAEQLERTFRTNIFSYFFMAKAALHISRRAARSSIPRRSRPIKAVPICWTTRQPRVRSSHSPVRSLWPSRKSAFVSMPWHLGRFGRR